ncbi:Glycosyltransferase sdnJ [Colletotrichum sp. SAR 10_77]|nr:Glycosyltransferase sdnJ [Colletotrichum sp. SAR 10_76]KAI8218670.1 Glycosyltransferase sdnJ [Colletotrichum sp. SAR 10_77]KAJ5008289.1 Glycosyltransferase sdnJ [Colletotrichum sp. SAR 10_66]
MAPPKKRIIFLTNSDYGQANVVLSVAHALVHKSQDVEVHIASQARLKGPTSRLVKQLTADLGSAAVDAVKFHEVAGLSHFDSVDRPGNPTMETWLVNPNFSNVTRNMLNIAGLALPWSPEEFVEIYRDLERIWNDVKPDVTVAEAFFAPALTFCNRIKMNWIVLAPNTIKDFALPLQPKMAMLWKYPVPDIDFPFEVLPTFITPCGPITRAAPAISDTTQDPEMASWLSRGPTVYMNLGTHHFFDVPLAKEVALAFRRLFDLAKCSEPLGQGNLQVLWKMPRKTSDGDDTDPSSTDFLGPWKEIKSILSPEMDNDQIRILDWIIAEPKSVLESGNVVFTGIPQVVLPGWADCYDFAQRAEILGIGKWANRKAKPYWKRDEFGDCLEGVLFGPHAKMMQARAMDLSKRHPEGAGRLKAAEEILALLDGPKFEA